MNQNTKNKNNSYKTCPYCGQGIIPFKLGVCICGNQVGNIQYVQNAGSFVRNYYSYVGYDVLKYDTAIEETFAGIEEFEFSD